MKVVLDGIPYWRHHVTGCLHIAMAALLGHRGLDPLEVLGARWAFYYDRRDLRREEYYLPCREDSLLAGLAPYHPVSSNWHEPADAEEAWQDVRSAIVAGNPVAVAADNFHLPFRPAYQDVHTNHLITVFGFDDARDEVFVTDAVPPRFTGTISTGELATARGSLNPIRHERDLFFTGNPIANRWLDIATSPAMPAFDEDFVHRAIASNATAFRSAESPGETPYIHQGSSGELRFLTGIADALAAGHAEAADEGFVVAGPVLATTGVHADWLAHAGRSFGDVRLVEAARLVERVAHHWTAFRIAVATARADPPRAAESLHTRARELIDDHERAVAALEGIVSA